MSDWNFGFTSLRIVKLFAESTAEKHCCADIIKKLDVPQQTAWNALRSMTHAQIVIPEKERIHPMNAARGAGARVFYRLSAYGQQVGLEALAAVQFNGTIILSS